VILEFPDKATQLGSILDGVQRFFEKLFKIAMKRTQIKYFAGQ
jgi:hypothetical protein